MPHSLNELIAVSTELHSFYGFGEINKIMTHALFMGFISFVIPPDTPSAHTICNIGPAYHHLLSTQVSQDFSHFFVYNKPIP
jgi:hypothetical protein